ncbi:AAA family ATPase [Mucilaginibacter panaciglaebae]|uniref:AAA+ ATPase domain-containing protein n=1 Tax=Mucilaginibacter panaciglaebae TaxID=502331 RepID=A0ABP7WZ25_9SPHI
MKVKSLKIEGYKNLDIDLVHQSDIIALIGNNGSGKSNLLEALSYIFRSLYRSNENVSFDYYVEYNNQSGQNIKIDKKKSKLTFHVDDNVVISISEYLPKKVVAIYSGEEDRLWAKCFFPFYDDFIKTINKSKNIGISQSLNQMPQMLYLNKYYWSISLLSLALSDLDDNKNFVKKALKIDQINKIKFEYEKSNYAEYNDNVVLDFVKKIDIKSEYTLTEFKKIIDENQYIPDDVYKLLYLAFSPKNTKIIDDITIKFNDYLTVEDLSEGEKKLLLIKAAFEFSEQEDSLFILDEPDAHIHLNNKEQIVKIFEPYKHNRQIILTTHSPTVTQSMEDNNLYMVNSGKIIERKKQEIIGDLTDEFWNKHQQSTFLSSKKKLILLVEGKHDKMHISNAFEMLRSDYTEVDFDIFSLGGESKIHPFMNGLYEANIQNDVIYIGIYDNDSAGLDTLNKAGFNRDDTNCGYRKLKGDVIAHDNFFAFALIKPDNHTSSCTIENMYLPEKYEAALREAFDKSIGNYGNKSIDDINKKIKEDSKNILAENSKSFSKSDFQNFPKLFDLITKIKKTHAAKIPAKNTQVSKIATRTNLDKVVAKESIPEIHTFVKKEVLSAKKQLYTEDDHLTGIPQEISTLYHKLKSLIVSLDSEIIIAPLKDYIAFKKNKNIVDVTILKKSLKIWINLKKGKLADPENLARDVSNIGHWGNGDYEILIKDDTKIEYISELVTQVLVHNQNN